MERRNLSSTAWIDEGKLPAQLALDFEDIWSLKPEQLGQVWMYGKLVTTPRWVKSFGKPYQFSGITHEADEVPVVLRPLLSWANSLNMGEFHQVLVNFYIGPSHGISAHSDAEEALIEHSPIVSVSLGAQRVLRIRQKANRQIVCDIPMPDRSYLIMQGTMQRDYTHEVPKSTSKKLPQVDRRINITFRQFKSQPSVQI